MNKEEPRFLERGYKSDSYIFAVNNNRIPLKLDPPLNTDVICGVKLFISQKVGLLKLEDVELYRIDSFWRRLRLFLCITFWVTWILLFLTALCLVFASPKCDSVNVRKWWTSALIYEIWTSSFEDSNSDGVGDLLGLRSRLTDLRRLGINAIFPRQLLKADATGMGVINFVKVDEKIGNSDDALVLINACHAAGMKVIIDFPLVVTSSSHNWFQRSVHAHLPENAKFSSFYYWKRDVVPSAFIAEYQNSSMFYFHMRGRPDLPILNWNSALVSQAIKRALSFWIDKGVDGIHFSSIDYLHRSFDGFQPEWNVIINFLRGIKNHIESYSGTTREIFVIASPGDLNEEQKWRLSAESGFSGIMNTELTRIALRNRICYRDETTVAGCVNEILADLLRFYITVQKEFHRFDTNETKYTSVWPVWSFSNSFTSRMSTRLQNRHHAELLMMVELCLPGTPVIFYGEELGLGDCCYDADPIFRGRGRMPWHFSSSAFVMNNNSLSSINFSDEMSNEHSQLSTFRRLVRLRRHYHQVLGPRGAVQLGTRVENTFAMCRYTSLHSPYDHVIVLVINFGEHAVDLPLTDLAPFIADEYANKNLLRTGTILVASSGARHYLYEQLDFSSGRITIDVGEGIVFKLNS